MYITLQKIRDNLCKSSTDDYNNVCKLVVDTKEKLTIEQILQILDSGIPAKDLIYQIRSFTGGQVKQFYVEFAVRRARSVLHLTANPAAEKAIQDAEKWLKNPTEKNTIYAAAYADAAADAADAAAAAAAADAAYAAAAAADDAADAARKADSSIAVEDQLRRLFKILRELGCETL